MFDSFYKDCSILSDDILSVLFQYHDEYARERFNCIEEIARLERFEIGLYRPTWIEVVWILPKTSQFRCLSFQVSFSKWKYSRPRIDHKFMQHLFGGLYEYQINMNRLHGETITYRPPKRGTDLPYIFQF